jgi:hypothetical protein
LGDPCSHELTVAPVLQRGGLSSDSRAACGTRRCGSNHDVVANGTEQKVRAPTDHHYFRDQQKRVERS